MKRLTFISRIFTLSALFLLHFPAAAQVNSTGIPIIHNYSHRVYNAAEANWSIAQDNRGVLYFGNTQAVLEFDGHTWNKIPIKGQQLIYSLATGVDGTIYVGGTDDFGRLRSDNKGQLEYESFRFILPDTASIPRVWKIYSSQNSIYFCTLQRIFIYSIATNTIEEVKLPDDSFFSFLVNDILYVGNYNLGLHSLENGKIVPVVGGQYFIKKDIFSILPWDQNLLLIATAEKGLNILNTQTGVVSDFNFTQNALATNKILLENNIYAGTTISETQFAYGTRFNGVYIINKQGAIINHISPQQGLKSEIISNLYYNQESPGLLWITTADGISSANISSPVRVFSAESGLNGTIYGITKHNGVYYAATMHGVFMLTHKQSESSFFKQVEGITGEAVYSLVRFSSSSGQNHLLAASEKEIYEIKSNKAYPLNIKNEVFRLIQSTYDQNSIYVATSRGIRRIKYQNNRFIYNNEIFGLRDDIAVTNIIEDKDGNLWCDTFSGIQLINYNGEFKELPEAFRGKSGKLFKLQNDIFFAYDNDVYLFNQASQNFEPYQPFIQLFASKEKFIREFFPVNDSTAVAFFDYKTTTGVDFIYRSRNGWEVDTTALRLVPSMTIQVAFQDQNLTFIGGQEGLYVHNNDNYKDINQPFRTIIRSIIIGNDSILYKGSDGFYSSISDQGQKVEILSIPIRFKDNNIIFTYASPFFESESKLEYKSYLEGFNTTWSPWESSNTRNYTNLSEGTYRFHVKARNVYGAESDEAIFEFKILPPWYRTWWAYIIYIALVVAAVRLLIAWYTRKLQEDKKRLEAIVKERTAEIVEKNKKIELQNIAITDSIRYAKRIQTAVLPDKQTCKLFDYFIYFSPKDIVSGDFYWVHHFEKQKRLIFIAADCTGHGVPGAFMSMLGTSFLNEIVAKLDVNHSDSILNLLREYVINTLSQGLKEGDKDERKDGMDMALASIDLNTMMLEFSGANNPLVLIRNGELIEYKPDKMPIGAYVKQNIPFQRTEIQLQSGDIFYMFSDGYVDQFGGDNGRKYMKKNFKEYLLSIHQFPMKIQKEKLYFEMINWMEGHEQIDDQLVIGVRANF